MQITAAALHPLSPKGRSQGRSAARFAAVLARSRGVLAEKIGEFLVMGGTEWTLHSSKCGSGIQHSSARRYGIRLASQWTYAWRTPIERVPTLCRSGRGPEARDYFVTLRRQITSQIFHSRSSMGEGSTLRMHVAVVHVGVGENR